MPTTVTGNIKDLTGTSVTSASNAFVRLWLRGTRGSQPRIVGTGAIAPQVAGNRWYVDLAADGSGNVSGSVYSTRDAAGTGNGEIETSGSYTQVWYGLVVYSDGIAGDEIPVHAKQGATLDISNITAITTPPTVIAPAGDNTYLRLDGGNSPATGSIDTKVLNGVVYADQYSGSTWDAKMLAAISALPSAGGVVDATHFTTPQTVAASLTISKSNVTILLGNYTVALGTHQIIVSPGVHGVVFRSTMGKGSSGSALGAVFTYTGTGAAFQVGSSASDTFDFQMHDVTVKINTANTSTAIGIQLNRVINYLLKTTIVYGSTTASNTQKLIDLEGTGNFTGGLIQWPYLNNGGYGIYFGDLANANTVIGGQIPGLSTGVGIYMKQNASGGNFIYGPDIENQGIAVQCGQSYNYITFRGEGNTKMVQLDAGASNNRIISVPMSPSSITDNSGNSTNSFEVTGVSVPAWNGAGGFTLKPFLDSDIQWTIQPGNTADYMWELVVRDHAGVNKMALGLDSSLRIFMGDGTLNRFLFDPGGNSHIQASNGAFAVNINDAANSGVDGLQVFSGGASPSMVATINGSGVGTFNGGVSANNAGISNAGAIAGATSVTASGLVTGSTLKLTGAAPSVSAAQVGFGATTASTVGAAGGASPLPATPSGYLIVNIAGTDFKIPYFAS